MNKKICISVLSYLIITKLLGGTIAYSNPVAPDWDPDICTTCLLWDVCWDVAYDDCLVTVADALKIISGWGTLNSPPCVDGVFSTDGYTDSYDTLSWDYMLKTECYDWCGPFPFSEVLYGGGGGSFTGASGLGASSGGGELLDLSDLNDLLISGKRGTTDSETKLKDRLYVFDSNYHYREIISLEPNDRCNIRIVRGQGNDLYQINSEKGLLRLETGMQIVPPGQIDYDVNEPRYNRPATVYVGIQVTGSNPYGRPILDAAFDTNYVYVVPVVVVPDSNEPYTAVAKVQLDLGLDPPYHIAQLYDGPILPSDGNGQYRNTLREIELDSEGNVYVTNAHWVNESDILWKFEPNGTVHRLNLDLIDPCVRAPTGMCVSSSTNILYLVSSLYNEEDPNSKIIYGFSTNNFNLVRTITVQGIQHVTGITEDPVTKSLWVAGLSFNSLPTYPNPYTLPFYDPYMAKIPPGVNSVSAVCILDANYPDYDLAMPLSICWTGALPEKCGGADLDGSGTVSLPDLAWLAQYWLNIDCVAPSYCEGADLYPETNPDGKVDLWDLDVLAEHWLDTGCLSP